MLKVLCYFLLLLIKGNLFSHDLVAVPSSDSNNDNEASVESDDGIDISNDEVFVPTEEWQEVKPGQRVPSGLHVRLNLETGRKEAKILTDDKTNFYDSGESHEALKEALKNIKSDESNADKSEFDPSTFRTMEELKEALGAINLEVETDIEIVSKLVKEFQEATENDKTTILDDLEYYVHQYDNALLFVDLGGLQKIIIPSLNSSNISHRKYSCLLLSGAAQSNPKFQIAALEHGLVETLLRMTVLDQDPEVSTKAFSAMSAIIRNFPEAQNSLLRQGGLGVLIKIFENENSVYEKLKIKILTMINDLLIERDNSAQMTDETSIKRKFQYNDVDSKFSIEAQIIEHGWCHVFSKMLILPER